jgi:hypothetical protein
MSLVGVEQIMFDTDHPFFPPHVSNAALDSTEWHSPKKHCTILRELGHEAETAILHRYAIAALNLAMPG